MPGSYPTQLAKAEVGNHRIFLLFMIFITINLVLYGVISASIVVPKLERSLNELRHTDLERISNASAGKMDLFFDDRIKVTEDLANNPQVINAAMLSQGNDPNFRDFISTYLIFGQTPEITIYNVAGEKFYQSHPLSQELDSKDMPWFERLNNSNSKKELKLLLVEGSSFKYLLATPIYFNNYVEGVLAISLEADMTQFTSGVEALSDTTIRLCDSTKCVKSGEQQFATTTTISKNLALSNTRVVIDFDWNSNNAAYKKVASDTLYILLFAAGLSFILFALLGYPILIRPYQRLEIQKDQLELFKSAMENAVEGVAKFNSEGHYTYVNDAYTRLSGYKNNELLGKHWHETITTKTRKSIELLLKKAPFTDKITFEGIGLRKDNSEYFILLTLVPFYAEDNTAQGYFCFGQDITTRKKQS